MMILASNYAVLRNQLDEDISKVPWPSPEAGFLDYLDTSTGLRLPCERTIVNNRLNETPMLSSAGYQYATLNFVPPADYHQEWARQFHRLAQRQAFPIDRESYFYRPLDLLGICIGARFCPALGGEDRRWLQEVLREGVTRLSEHSRSHYLGAIAAWHLGVPWSIHSVPALDELSLAMLSLLYWIVGQNDLATALGVTVPAEALANPILRCAFTVNNQYDDLADAGLIRYATQYVVDRTIQAQVSATWQTPLNRTAATELVRNICDRFSIVAKTLTQRHQDRPTITISDEYDMQDLLAALLKLHFTDVRPEEWTPSYAGNASRMDFLLKPEQLVVEAKMTRKNLGQKEVVAELAEDILRYQAHQDCKTLVCFVYDPIGKCSNPVAIENDLTKNHGAVDVVVIVRPTQR
jgi:hypothetical protein